MKKNKIGYLVLTFNTENDYLATLSDYTEMKYWDWGFESYRNPFWHFTHRVWNHPFHGSLATMDRFDDPFTTMLIGSQVDPDFIFDDMGYYCPNRELKFNRKFAADLFNGKPFCPIQRFRVDTEFAKLVKSRVLNHCKNRLDVGHYKYAVDHGEFAPEFRYYLPNNPYHGKDGFFSYDQVSGRSKWSSIQPMIIGMRNCFYIEYEIDERRDQPNLHTFQEPKQRLNSWNSLR